MTVPDVRTPSEAILKDFGKRVYRERKKNSITQEQLAEQVLVSVDTIKRIESGQGARLDVAYHIANVLRVPIQSLLPPQDCTKGDDKAYKIRAVQDVMRELIEIISK